MYSTRFFPIFIAFSDLGYNSYRCHHHLRSNTNTRNRTIHAWAGLWWGDFPNQYHIRKWAVQVLCCELFAKRWDCLHWHCVHCHSQCGICAEIDCESQEDEVHYQATQCDWLVRYASCIFILLSLYLVVYDTVNKWHHFRICFIQSLFCLLFLWGKCKQHCNLLITL